MFGLVERFIGAKMLELSRDHWLGDQVALEALVRFDRRGAEAPGAVPPPRGDGRRGHACRLRVHAASPTTSPRRCSASAPGPCSALTCHIELFTQAHYRSSIEPDADLSELWKDVFLFHWKEESQHAILDELEWRREHARCDAARARPGVDDLIELVGAVDGIVQMQAQADADYFFAAAGRRVLGAEQAAVHDVLRRPIAGSTSSRGAQEPRFVEVLTALPRRRRRRASATRSRRSPRT